MQWRNGVDRTVLSSLSEARAEEFAAGANADFPTMPRSRVICQETTEPTRAVPEVPEIPEVRTVPAIETIPGREVRHYPWTGMALAALGVLGVAGVATGLTIVWASGSSPAAPPGGAGDEQSRQTLEQLLTATLRRCQRPQHLDDPQRVGPAERPVNGEALVEFVMVDL